MIHCPECESESVSKNGHRWEHQRFKCKDCGNSFLDIHIKEFWGVQVTGLNGNVDEHLQNIPLPTFPEFPIGKTETVTLPEPPEEFVQAVKESVLAANPWLEEAENCMDEMTDKEVGNQMIIGKKVSQKPSHVWLRAHKHDPFDTPQFSKKYDFWFNSWGEYFSKRYTFNKMKKKAQSLLDNSDILNKV